MAETKAAMAEAQAVMKDTEKKAQTLRLPNAPKAVNTTIADISMISAVQDTDTTMDFKDLHQITGELTRTDKQA